MCVSKFHGINDLARRIVDVDHDPLTEVANVAQGQHIGRPGRDIQEFLDGRVQREDGVVHV